MEMSAAGVSASIMGTKKGLRRPGPRAARVAAASWMGSSAPMPLPTTTPAAMRAGSSASPASASACPAAARASCVSRAMRRASLRPKWATGSKPFTSPAMRVS